MFWMAPSSHYTTPPPDLIIWPRGGHMPSHIACIHVLCMWCVNTHGIGPAVPSLPSEGGFQSFHQGPTSWFGPTTPGNTRIGALKTGPIQDKSFAKKFPEIGLMWSKMQPNWNSLCIVCLRKSLFLVMAMLFCARQILVIHVNESLAWSTCPMMNCFRLWTLYTLWCPASWRNMGRQRILIPMWTRILVFCCGITTSPSMISILSCLVSPTQSWNLWVGFFEFGFQPPLMVFQFWPPANSLGWQDQVWLEGIVGGEIRPQNEV